MIKDLLTLNELQGRVGPFKFILLEESNFVFAEITAGCISHRQMAEHMKEHGKPLAAGSIMLFETQWHPIDLYSSSLGIECSFATLKDLRILIQKTLGKVMTQTAVFQNSECN